MRQASLHYTQDMKGKSAHIDNGVRPLITIFAQRKRKISPKQTLTNIIYYKRKTEKKHVVKFLLSDS